MSEAPSPASCTCGLDGCTVRVVDAKQTTGKKPSRNPKGRPKGSPNKATTNARELLGLLVEANIPKMSGWLTAIEKEHGPLMAWRCMQDVAEYHVPKLQRTEVVGDGGGPVQITINKLA
jgi:hypothetical protein